jgi:hypothetical protein
VRREDVQRSARRWLWLALDDDAWSLEDERIEVADDQRPVGIVETTTGLAVGFARTAVPQGDVQKRATLTLTLYPSAAGTAQECGRRARELVDAITDAWTVGIIIPGAPEVPLYPSALPLWNFGGVADDVTVPGPPVSYAIADSVTVRDIADPLDDRRWTVVAELRVTWWSGGRSRWGSAVPETVDDTLPIGPHITL